MLHALEANVHTECSPAISAQEPLNVSCLVMPDTEFLESARLTEDAGIDFDRLDD
jgi:hypothetical protein